jgi:hypothetical protein
MQNKHTQVMFYLDIYSFFFLYRGRIDVKIVTYKGFSFGQTLLHLLISNF